MSRRREYSSDKTRKIIKTINITSSMRISPKEFWIYSDSGSAYMGLMIVGAGGGGGGDAYSAGGGGGGGCGGEVTIVEDITVLKNVRGLVTIGAGGAGGNHGANGANGGETTFEYNNITYTARGGWGGYNPSSLSEMNNRPRLGDAGYGGAGGGYKEDYNIKRYYNRTYEDALAATPLTWSVKGEEGIKNPFDSTDTTIYSSGGGAGYNCYNGYDMSSTYPNYGGTGAGRGGYGGNNASTNKGAAATSYGCGGGGGAFSSGHSYSQGGNGYQGIVRIYFYKYV